MNANEFIPLIGKASDDSKVVKFLNACKLNKPPKPARNQTRAYLTSPKLGIEVTFEDEAELDLDDPRDDEILVRVKGVGLCHTDLIARDGMMPFAPPAVLGHEGSGIVERVGAKVRKVKRGDAVGITFRSCGVCPRCKRGDPAYCHTMPQLNYAGMRPDGSTASGSARYPASFFGVVLSRTLRSG